MKKTLLSLLLVPFFGMAQNQYSYGFDGATADLTTAGWVRTNQSTPTTATLWTVASYTPVVVNSTALPPVTNLPFGNTVLPDGATCPPPNGQAGGANSFALVNFTSTTGNNTISNWLISPVVTVQNGDIVTFYSRLGKIPGSAGAQFPDRLQLRMSTSATTTNPSTGATDLGSFTVLLSEVNPTLVTGVYPQVWTQYTATISGLSAPTAVKFGFRYFVTSGGPSGANSDIIGIDTFSVDRPTAGTSDFFAKNFSVYPNPSTGIVNLASKNNASINAIQLTDLNGRVVKNLNANGVTDMQINISDLTSGVYFLNIQTDAGSGTTKIVKN